MIWPFTTISRLTAERDEARAKAEDISTSYAQFRETACSLAEGYKAENRKLRALFEEAHFRNPKTGRLGTKGQRFD